jgi:hypothetical protein
LAAGWPGPVFGSALETPEMNGSLKLARDRFPLMIALLVCGAMPTGCATREGDVQQTNLRGLAAYYSQYQAKNRGQLPANEKALKEFIAADLSAAGAPASADKIDAIFVSNRDGKPFIIRYGGDKAWQYPDLMAYEQEGRNGMRHVGYTLGGVEALSEEQFRNLAK